MKESRRARASSGARGLPLLVFPRACLLGGDTAPARSLSLPPSLPPLRLLCIFRVPPLAVKRENATEGIVGREKARAARRTRAECLRAAKPRKVHAEEEEGARRERAQRRRSGGVQPNNRGEFPPADGGSHVLRLHHPRDDRQLAHVLLQRQSGKTHLRARAPRSTCPSSVLREVVKARGQTRGERPEEKAQRERRCEGREVGAALKFRE